MKTPHKTVLLIAGLILVFVLANVYSRGSSIIPHVEINLQFQISVNGDNDLRKES